MENDKYNWFIYNDEPIQNNQNQVKEEKNTLPQELKKARLLENNINVYNQPSESLFCLQGKLLEDYEDNFEYTLPVVHYFPTYKALTNDELRGYFTWRTKIRNGIIEKTSLSYAFLYIYELLNQIGTDNPLDGFRKLKYFKEEYEKLDEGITKYLIKWLRDYVVYYHLDVSLLDNSIELTYDNNLLILINIDKHSDQEILNAINFLSSYKISNSPFYKVYKDDMEQVIVKSFRRINDYYNKHHKNKMIDDYFMHSTVRPVILFMNCVFYFKMKEKETFIFDEIRSYKCTNGYWSANEYSMYSLPNRKLGDILKSIDSILRDQYNFPRPLKKETNLKWMEKIINEEIKNYLVYKEKNKKKEINIDYSILKNIREDSNIIRDKLIVEEETLENINEVLSDVEQTLDTTENNVITNTNTLLNEDEYHLLKTKLYNLDSKWIKEKGIIVSVLVDGINEKLYDVFNDTVIENNDRYEDIMIIEDYLEDLKGMIKQ